MEYFDAEKAVWAYRRIRRKLERPSTPANTRKLQAEAKQMETAWKDWQGEDSLYEMAFGEPWEWKDEPK